MLDAEWEEVCCRGFKFEKFDQGCADVFFDPFEVLLQLQQLDSILERRVTASCYRLAHEFERPTDDFPVLAGCTPCRLTMISALEWLTSVIE